MMISTPLLEKIRLSTNPYGDPTQIINEIELPTEDGEQLESHRHRKQINLLIDCMEQARKGKADFFAGGNMFVHYDLEVALRRGFRGPDFFVVLDVDGSHQRQSWVVWKEGGRYPDVIVELLSTSTAHYDLHEKKRFYEQIFHTPEYFCYDPFDADSLVGWRLQGTKGYAPIRAQEDGWLWSQKLNLYLGPWFGVFQKEETDWLRFYDKDGELIPTAAEEAIEMAIQETYRAEQAAQRAEQEAQRAEQEAIARAAAEDRIRQLEEQLRLLQEQKS